jgi:hypothetical protein
MRLHPILMASCFVATFLSLCASVEAAGNAPISSISDESGHKVYVNDIMAPPVRPTFRTRENRLVFWSSSEHRWKPVPHANVQAARSAAEEVGEYLGKSSQQNSLPRAGFRPEEIDAAIEKAAARHRIDPNLVRALVKVESNFNPNAVSRKGAMGLMQLMPQTARQLNLRNPFNPEENLDAGVRHLKQLLESFGGDVRLSLAAYNAGTGAVARSAGIPNYRETRNYVKRITELYDGGLGTALPGASREPLRIERDARGVLYISNTD